MSAAGVAEAGVTQLLRQGDAKVFKKYFQMKLQMKRGALQKLHRHANESKLVFGTGGIAQKAFATVLVKFGSEQDQKRESG